ncbi:unnamed protein product [Allacma fusca]|uniref:Uncharacterized protein n=1 Tax=Allacma fusca TaxID=39272 RepID=A0A8J2P1A1_9HEXA|nr:unnamed protein product [Allacma fusca]
MLNKPNKKLSVHSDVSDKEAWDTPILCNAITNKRVYQETRIPLHATSYDQPKRVRLFQRWREKLKRKIKRNVIKPLFRRETVSKVVWRSDFESAAAFLALAFSACTLLRFPYVCVKFGTGLFFLVYVLIILFVMQPVMFTMTVLGRVTSSGMEKYPLFYLFAKGTPLVVLYMTLVFITNNNVVLGYSGVYVLAQLLDTPPDVCTPRMKRHSDCVAYKEANPLIHSKFALPPNSYLSTDLFFRYYIQGDKWKQNKGYFISVRECRFFVGMSLVFLVVFLAVYKNIVSTLSRILIYGTYFLPVCIIGLTIFQVIFEGAIAGMSYQFVGMKWKHLLTVEFWSEAWSFAFCSCFPGYGLLTSFGNYKTSLKGVYLLTWLICFAVIIFSGISVCLVATEMGILENHGNIPNYFDIVANQAALSYVCLTNIMIKIPSVWPSVIFFAYVTVFGLWSQVVATETCITYVLDFCTESYPSLGLSNLNRAQIAAGLIIVEIIIIISYGSEAGPFMFEAHFIFGGSWAACIISIIRIYITTRFYGYDVFQLRLECKTVGFIFLTLGLFLLEQLFHQINHVPTYGALIYGWTLNVIPLVILLFYVLRRVTWRKPNQVEPTVVEGVRLHESMDNTIIPNRLNIRRNAVFIQNELLDPDLYASDKKEILQEEANAFHYLQGMQKLALTNLLRRKRIQSLWHKSFAKTLLSAGLVKRFPIASTYFGKKTAADIAKQDVEYLEKVLRTYSVENVFHTAEIASSNYSRADGGKLRYQMMRSLLLDQTDVEKNLFSREASSVHLWTEVREPQIPGTLMAIIYADHIMQELGNPYANQYDWDCYENFGEFQSENQPLRETLMVEPKEYVVKYKLKNQLERVVHVLVIEGKRNPILMRLSDPEPPCLTINYKVLESKTDKEKFRLICGKALLFLHENHKRFFDEMDPSATVRPDDLRPNKYKDMIANHFGAGPLGFLDPTKVCIAVIETESDAEFVRLENQFVNPLTRKGWLLKPTRRRLREEQRIDHIDELLKDKRANTEGVRFATFQEMYADSQLIALHDKLAAAPPDIVFKADDSDEDLMFMETDANSSTIEVLQPHPLNFDRFQDSGPRMSGAQELAKWVNDDEDFHLFLTDLRSWKNPRQKDLRQHSDHTSQVRVGRRRLSEPIVTNLDSQRPTLFPMGTLPMKVVRAGPSSLSVSLSTMSLPSIKFSVSTKQTQKLSKDKGVGFHKFQDSLETLWSQVPSDVDDDGIKSVKSFHHKSLALLIADKRKDNNNDGRYLYREFGDRLEIELKEENFVMATSKDSIGEPSGHRSLFGIFKRHKT